MNMRLPNLPWRKRLACDPGSMPCPREPEARATARGALVSVSPPALTGRIIIPARGTIILIL